MLAVPCNCTATPGRSPAKAIKSPAIRQAAGCVSVHIWARLDSSREPPKTLPGQVNQGGKMSRKLAAQTRRRTTARPAHGRLRGVLAAFR